MRAIVLCGGLGTRLGPLTSQTPKPLLEVGNKPFVSHVLESLRLSGISSVCLAVSFHWQKLKFALGDSWQGMPISYSVETEPLGTGGAVRQAAMQMGCGEVFVANGDTLVATNLNGMREMASARKADCVLTLKHLSDTSRFGTVSLAGDGRITSFSEKTFGGSGFINAGLYWLGASVISRMPQGVFSLEKDFLAKDISSMAVYGFVSDGYFVDMGVPDDLARARRELAQ